MMNPAPNADTLPLTLPSRNMRTKRNGNAEQTEKFKNNPIKKYRPRLKARAVFLTEKFLNDLCNLAFINHVAVSARETQRGIDYAPPVIARARAEL